MILGLPNMEDYGSSFRMRHALYRAGSTQEMFTTNEPNAQNRNGMIAQCDGEYMINTLNPNG